MELYESILKQLREQEQQPDGDAAMDPEEFQLAALKAAARKLEQSIKDRKKPKTITISGDSHNRIKTYCATMGLNIGKWTEQVLLREITDNACIERVQSNYEEYINETAESIKNKYTTMKTRYKTDKLLVCDGLRLVGESSTTGDPVYELTDDSLNPIDVAKNLTKWDITVEITDDAIVPLALEKYEMETVFVSKSSLSARPTETSLSGNVFIDGRTFGNKN
jgi:hypothetical protein